MWQTVSDSIGFDESYLHNDLIGTLRVKSDSLGNVGGRPIYTAFGELVNGSVERFGYVGAWGYQSTSSLPFLHVGYRYYDPATGRFLQRDPMGIPGGLNVYAYTFNQPTWHVDPFGTAVSPYTDAFAENAFDAAKVGGLIAIACSAIPGLQPAAPPIATASGILAGIGALVKAVGRILDWLF